ncbi:hypothetical protein [Achromobacter aegrifaciens]
MDVPAIDWSWFFSSVAQSAAAIVGIVGAFVIGKVLAQQTDYQEKCSAVQRLIDQAQDLKRRWEQLPRWEIDNAYRRLADMAACVKLYEDPKLVEGDFPKAVRTLVVFPPWIDDKWICAETEGRQKAARSHLALKKLRDMRAKQPGSEYLEPLRLNLGPSIIQEAFPAADAEVQDIANVRQQILEHIERIEASVTVTRKVEARWVTPTALSLVAALFFAGVIYPLSFLPIRPGDEPVLSLGAFWEILCSLRGAILSAISLGFVALVGLFGLVHVRSTGLPARWDKLLAWRELSSYSPDVAFDGFDKTDIRAMSWALRPGSKAD